VYRHVVLIGDRRRRRHGLFWIGLGSIDRNEEINTRLYYFVVGGGAGPILFGVVHAYIPKKN